MGNTEKIRVLLKHWIDHNREHAAEYQKWQETLIDDGLAPIAGLIGAAVSEMEKVNGYLVQALEEAGGSDEDSDHHHDHHHHHHHH